MISEKIISITVLSGPLKDEKFLVKPAPQVLIGREDDAAIKLAYDDYCSIKQAIVYREDNRCFIEDLNSARGTYLNDIFIRGKNELKDKDIIGLGNTRLAVSITDAPKEENIAPNLATKIKAGDSVYGRYEVYHILQAGMGIACACYDNITRAPCVLKTLQRKYLLSSQNQAFFEKAAVAWIELGRYPYIVSASLVMRIENYPFVVLEYIAPDENGVNTLVQCLSSLTLSEMLKYSIEFCYGMEYAYTKGLKAHGNIKPANIMLTSDKTVKITDFGFAKVLQDIDFNENIPEKIDLEASIFKSNGKVVSGTLAYMAPEQFEGQMNQLSDIYSFGVVLYQMAKYGTLPFSGRDPLEYEKAHKQEAAPALDSPLSGIIMKCLEKDPGKRYADFTGLRSDLEDLLLKKTGNKITLPEGTKLEAWEAMNKGAALYYFGRQEGGLACYDKAIALNPASSHAYYIRGDAHYDKGNFEQAIADYSRALEINPVYIKAYYRRGVFYQSKANMVLTISDYNKVIAIDSTYLDVHFNRGNAYYDKGDLEHAISDYSRAIEINPAHFKAYNSRGNAYCDKGELELAIADYSKAIEISPKDTQAYNSRGIAYLQKGKLALAIADYSKAIEISPKDTQAYNNRGIAYHRKGDLELAIADYNKAIEINPKDAEAYYNRGISYHKKGNFEQAIADYDLAIELNPKDGRAYNSRGIAYHCGGSLVQAIADYKKAIEIDPKDTEAYINLGIVYHKKGDFEQAIAYYNRAIEIDPTYLKAYYSRGGAYQDKGELVLAIADYSKVIEFNPKDAEVYNSRGIAYHLRGKLEQAIYDYSRAIMFNPAYAKAYCNRGSVYYDKGDLELAIADYSKAIEINPAYAKAYCNRGTVYCLKKDYDKSWKDVHKAEELGYKIPPSLINDLKKAAGR